jgi:hypothetical protein
MKEIKEFETFTGNDGYLLIDGLTEQVAGGKKQLSEVVGDKLPPVGSDQHRNQVLTVNSSDTVVWANDIDYCPDTLYSESLPFTEVQ